MLLKKSFSAITSKLPKLIKTLTSKLPNSLSTIANSSALNFLKSNQYVPQKIRDIARTVSDQRFQNKLLDVGKNMMGMAGTALTASSILGPQAGLAVQAVGLGKDIYDLYKGYKEVDEQIRNEQKQRLNRNQIQKIQSINRQQSRSYKQLYNRTKPITKSYAKIKKRPIGGYIKRN